MKKTHFKILSLSVVGALLVMSGCSIDASSTKTTVGSDTTTGEAVTLTLLAHESFTPSPGIFDAFTAATGVNVNVVLSGDAGELVTKAVLTSGNPEGDVLWGVDNTLLSRALDANVFISYQSKNLEFIDPTNTSGIPGNEVTPVDTGDVCINYDIAFYADQNLTPPLTLRALTSNAYKDQLVVPSPLSSSPGLAFFLATVVEFGESGWQEYWQQLRDNGVLVVDAWTEAYSVEFSGSSGKGDRPLVVSYASSPPAEVLFANPPITEAPTGVASLTCFRQVEYVGVLRGTKHAAEAQLLVDYLTDLTFQNDLPLTQFVYPVNINATLPEVFTKYSLRPENPLTLEPNVIAEHRTAWLDEWTQIVLR
ncbi:MAG: thiamine ABC transporter substrate-binding protein [Ilumatobacteraceae bacterium]